MRVCFAYPSIHACVLQDKCQTIDQANGLHRLLPRDLKAFDQGAQTHHYGMQNLWIVNDLFGAPGVQF